jgi:predicted AlkP superfamily phosphohydrolase/phosphomutase
VEEPQAVLAIGLDGATFDILDPWIRDGTLPALARLRRAGSSGRLASTVPPLTAPAWSSFMTGKNPGKHGVLHFFPLQRGSGAIEASASVVNSRVLRGQTLWDVLSRQGYRTAVLNVPMTYPPHEVNGVLVSGMLAPAGSRDYTHPPALASELGDYRVDLDYFLGEKMGRHENVPPLERLVTELRDLLEVRGRTAENFFGRENWDFFMVVFTGTDRLGHFLWPYHFPDHEEQQATPLHRAVRDYYVRLDRIVGALVEAAGDQSAVLLMSDHGMGPASDRVVYLNQWLQGQGLLRQLPVSSSWRNPNRWLAALGLSRDRLACLKNRLPTDGPVGRRVAKASRWPLPIDYQRSRAHFRTIYVSVGGIYIGEQYERGSPEYDRLCGSIIDGLAQIRDQETGESVVERVAHGRDIYPGESLQGAPDVIVVLKPRYRCNHRLGSAAVVGPRVETHAGRRVVGDHRSDGIFIAAGAGIRQSGEPVAGLRLEDLSPTILYLLDADIPRGLDGAVIEKAIDPHLLSRREPRYTDAHTDTDADGAPEGSPAHRSALTDRLRALGYVD